VVYVPAAGFLLSPEKKHTPGCWEHAFVVHVPAVFVFSEKQARLDFGSIHFAKFVILKSNLRVPQPHFQDMVHE